MNPQWKSCSSFWIVILVVSCCQKIMLVSLQFWSFFLIPINSRLIHWYRHVVRRNVEFAIYRYKIFQHLQSIGYFDDTWVYSGNFVTKSFGTFHKFLLFRCFSFISSSFFSLRSSSLQGINGQRLNEIIKRKFMKWM